MQYEIEVDPQELIEERRQQWHVLGITDAIMDAMIERITDMWGSGVGSWATEWSQEAVRALERGDEGLAVALFGAAKFPVTGSPAHVDAFQAQIDTFLEYARHVDDTVRFERLSLSVNLDGRTVRVPVHAYSAPNLPPEAPVVLVFSGVDTWKIEIDGVARAAARTITARVITIDMPGTGEAPIANSPHADQYVEAVLAAYRAEWPQSGRVGALGFSFAGHWTIKLALTHRVDAAVSIGGMVDEALQAGNVRSLRYGMKGIWGNSLRPDQPLDDDALTTAMAAFSLRTQGVLDTAQESAPLLFINGDQDQHSTPTDIDPLRAVPNVTVRMIPGATHCAAEHLGQVIPQALDWLSKALATS